jgi:membrane protein DedA with SNARE-associated domain
MPWRRFIVFNALGAALWVGLWVTLGYLAGTHIVAVYDALRRYELYVLVAAGVLVAAFGVRYLLHRRAIGKTQDPPD